MRSAFLKHSRGRIDDAKWPLLLSLAATAAVLTTNAGVVTKTTPSSSIENANDRRKVSVHAARGPRATMEDRWYVSNDLRFFAVYDGHGGHRVAEQAQKFLYDEFVKELNVDAKDHEEEPVTVVEDVNLVETAFVKSFNTVSQKVLSTTYLDMEGSTAVAVYLCDDNFIAANLGDSRAIISRGPRAFPLTTDHKPDSPSERKRIEDLGGKVKWHGYLGPDRLPVPGMGAYRINGNLAVSRALGDRLERPYVSSEPEITIVARKPDDDKFVVLASDGLWDVMSSQDVVDFVRQIMSGSITGSTEPTRKKRSTSSLIPFSSATPVQKKGDGIRNEIDKRKESMAQFIVEEALRRGSADNVTVLVVWLR